ncbi:hypothetical protein RvY_03039-2 [Ramazzottius varieornatus]|uniref:Glycosyltransferase family 92 protein n=1 Tax=Ramazzottius varieornatus TaxID=947166 RepID=A0A1D1UQ59_RAMVA|nr:hypothetical protein RvY_03039-2 [Ramazzottius varieornatus]
MKMWTIGLNCTKRRRQASSTTLVSVFSAELTAELTTLILLLNVISCCATCSATSLLPLRNNITICSYVRDTLPHVLEWIEFHRLQGVDKFMLYDDGSTDTTALLGRWDTSSHEYYTEGRYKFLMDVNPHRAPHPHLDNEYPLQHQAICQTTSFAEYCSHGTGKSIWMPDKCAIAAVHYCENLTFGEMRFVAVTDLRMDHYTFQSEDHIRGLIPLMKEVKGL